MDRIAEHPTVYISTRMCWTAIRCPYNDPCDSTYRCLQEWKSLRCDSRPWQQRSAPIHLRNGHPRDTRLRTYCCILQLHARGKRRPILGLSDVQIALDNKGNLNSVQVITGNSPGELEADPKLKQLMEAASKKSFLLPQGSIVQGAQMQIRCPWVRILLPVFVLQWGKEHTRAVPW